MQVHRGSSSRSQVQQLCCASASAHSQPHAVAPSSCVHHARHARNPLQCWWHVSSHPMSTYPMSPHPTRPTPPGHMPRRGPPYPTYHCGPQEPGPCTRRHATFTLSRAGPWMRVWTWHLQQLYSLSLAPLEAWQPPPATQRASSQRPQVVPDATAFCLPCTECMPASAHA